MTPSLTLVTAPAAAPEIAPVVERLAQLRHQAQRRRYVGETPKLPSRPGILAMAEDFCSVLFPRQLGDAAADDIDLFVASRLKRASEALERESGLEPELAGVGDATRPGRLAAAFVDALPTIRELVDSDIRASLEADPTQGSFDELVFCSPRIAAILRHRVAHQLYRLGAPLMAKIIAADARAQTGIDIHPGAEIGESFCIVGGTNVAIGETAVIGRNVRIHGSATIGDGLRIEVAGLATAADAEQEARRHPKIEDDVVIQAGAALYGRIVIGKGSEIGRNVWVTQDVAPYSEVVRAGGDAPR